MNYLAILTIDQPHTLAPIFTSIYESTAYPGGSDSIARHFPFPHSAEKPLYSGVCYHQFYSTVYVKYCKIKVYIYDESAVWQGKEKGPGVNQSQPRPGWYSCLG
jgi:hypothetical protein